MGSLYKNFKLRPQMLICGMLIGYKPNWDPTILPKNWYVLWLQSKQHYHTKILVMPLLWLCQNFGRASWGTNQTAPYTLLQLTVGYHFSSFRLFAKSTCCENVLILKRICNFHCFKEAKISSCNVYFYYNAFDLKMSFFLICLKVLVHVHFPTISVNCDKLLST